jgi:hypothetical protein
VTADTSFERTREGSPPMHRFAKISFVLMSVAAAALATDSTKLLVGVYTRESKTCGGPGVADNPSKMKCDLIVEDKLSVSPANAPGVEALEVAFTFHYGYGEYCQFSGLGTWDVDRLKLKFAGEELTPKCQLSLQRVGTTIRVRDPGGACRVVFCTAPGPVMDGLSFEPAK